jgi:hypothetical protein
MMTLDRGGSHLLADPLWVAAEKLAGSIPVVIRDDVAARRDAYEVSRDLVAAASHGLSSEMLDAARSSPALRLYPHTRGGLTRLAKDLPTMGPDSVGRILANQSAAIAADIAARQVLGRRWTQVGSAMAAGRVQLAQRILQEPAVAETDKLYPELAKTANRVTISVKRVLERSLTMLRDAVIDHARRHGWEATSGDRRVVIDQLITVELADDRTTRVQATRVRSLEWDIVRPILDGEYDRVWGRARREQARFADDLQRVLRSHRAENVRLRDVYDEIKALRPATPGRLVSYYRDEFSADLSVLLTSSAARRFEFSAIRDPRLAFAVARLGGALQQYGFIRIREA